MLFATSVGGHPLAPLLDSVVAMALWLRGTDVRFLLCDAALPACEQVTIGLFRSADEFVRHGPQARACGPCFGRGSAYYAPLPIPVDRYQNHLLASDTRRFAEDTANLTLEQCFSIEHNGMRLGEQARSNTLRFFGNADLSTEDPDLAVHVARRSVAAALTTAHVATRTFEDHGTECVVAHHGVYVPQGVIGEVARRAGVRVVNWAPSYRAHTAIYSHGDTYHRTFIDESVSYWERRKLTADEEAQLQDYLDQRRLGRGDRPWITPDAGLKRGYQQREELLRELDLDPDLPVLTLLTNVMWDAALYHEGQAFSDMLEWLWFTIEHVAARPGVQLVIRIHPHEVKAGNRQRVEREIGTRYRALPSNVRVVNFDSALNTYAIADLSRAVLIYGTKTGIELLAHGIPVVVAADSWTRNKQISLDARTRDEYASMLEQAPSLERLQGTSLERARRYAFHFFFRRMIPFASIAEGAEPLLGIDHVADLLPGRDPGLDLVCRGILNGEEFVFDA